MWRTFFKILSAFILLLVVLIGGFVATVYYGFFGHIANKQQLTEFKQAQATLVYSEDGEIIGKFFYTNRTNIPYEKLPKHLIQALIATEDARFYDHKGIDKTALLRMI
jgi:penicillin-binding protein 1A